MSLLLFVVLLSGCCGYALWRGGAPERMAAGLQVGAYVVDLALNRLFDGSTYARVQAGSAGLDLALLCGLMVLAHRSTRFWPLWVAGWQLAAVAGHLAKAIDPAMVPSGYAIQSALWSYPMLIATAAGAWRHRRRIGSGQIDPAWKVVAA